MQHSKKTIERCALNLLGNYTHLGLEAFIAFAKERVKHYEQLSNKELLDESDSLILAAWRHWVELPTTKL